ncbi:MAG: twin transmembrane helix small protein [Stellaceae bacterium]
MQIVLPVLVVIAMLATLGTLLVGVFWMARGGDPKRANAIMRYRVLFQGAALVLFFIFMMLYRR